MAKKKNESNWFQDISNYIGNISIIKAKPKISIDENVHRVIRSVRRGDFERPASPFLLAHGIPAHKKAARAGKSDEEAHAAGLRAANKALGKKGTATNAPEYRKISLSYNKQLASGTTIGGLFFKPRLSGNSVGAFAQHSLNVAQTIGNRRHAIDAIANPITHAFEAILSYGPHNLHNLYQGWKSSVKSEFFSTYRKEIEKQVLIDAQAIYRKTGAAGLRDVLTQASYKGIHTGGEMAAHIKGLQLSLKIRQRVLTNVTLGVVGTVAAAYLGNKLYQAYHANPTLHALDKHLGAANANMNLGKNLTNKTSRFRRPRVDRVTWNKNISIGRQNSSYRPERTVKPAKVLLSREEINKRISIGLLKSHKLRQSNKIR